MSILTLGTAVGRVHAPLIYKGKVRELYDLGEHMLIVVTDRISAFDYVLRPEVPDKGNMLNLISKFWFERTAGIQDNHVVHADIDRLPAGVIAAEDRELFRDRIMVAKKAKRIDIECVVRGYITGGGWRQYRKSGEVNGVKLPEGLRKNERLPEPIFTPAAKNDVGHDEDIPFERMAELVGADTAADLREKSLRLYRYAHDHCLSQGIILADTKFEFGEIDGRIILIDEIFTPDSSRYWAQENYALDTEIESMDKEPVRTYLAGSGWDKNSEPDPLPEHVVAETTRRYRDIYTRLTGVPRG
ncbi:phosphoribosylaminoimidazolesuccinocarboxamide synthase [Paenibacillus thermoaerophilus]|uniref:Phosphoribosylaminoimidazole-succinocarboxamide synthase n=1 Tax=Paenibacillus thermoaerophilus TaxID=1215385 RepID=A0ABW2V201_9BACL|nr:phosphoribosylaminoimidazolesuccinocarboxamide synthase [Paenibacillus thermoaerophilus]TMV13944.1 phosphoribosylaminoimidazolesuccinocarboxamide synthase [Paenibacillus thermoaerophilus]